MNTANAHEFLHTLPERCQTTIPGAVSGDADAACSLVGAACNADRGDIVAALYALQTPPVAFRDALTAVWDHDHGHLLRAVGRDKRTFNKFFRYAEYDTSHLPERFTIYRGGHGSRADLAFGLSWTLDRDCACWFAMNWDCHGIPPLVVRREVTRRGVLAYIDTRNEEEIVVAGVAHTLVDGDPSDWQQGHDRYVKKKEERKAADFIANKLEAKP